MNPSYSLRAFALRLRISPSFLSEILKGSKTLSQTKADYISKLIFEHANEQLLFKLLVRLDTATNHEQKKKLNDELQALEARMDAEPVDSKVLDESFDWYHPAIVHLLTIENGHLTSKIISDRLGISVETARSALERHLKVQEIRKIGPDQYERVHRQKTARRRKPKEPTLDHFVEQTLDIAKSSLKTRSSDETFYASQTFAFDKEQIPAVRAIVERFFGELKQLIEEGQNKTEVYHLGTQLFPLTARRSQLKK